MENEIKNKLKRLSELIESAREHIEGYVDVEDDKSDGGIKPNKAMKAETSLFQASQILNHIKQEQLTTKYEERTNFLNSFQKQVWRIKPWKIGKAYLCIGVFTYRSMIEGHGNVVTFLSIEWLSVKGLIFRLRIPLLGGIQFKLKKGHPIVLSKWIPFGKYVAMAFWPVVFVKKPIATNLNLSRILNHEFIHLEQQKELFVIPFYLIYVLEFCFHFLSIWNWDQAYRSISFEREAFAHQHDLLYNSTRKRFAMWRKPDAKP